MNKSKCQSRVVCFIGISNKPGDDGPVKPLSETTLSGKVISTVESKLRGVSGCSVFFRDNLVQKPPVSRGKLRYPTLREMKSEWESFEQRLADTESHVVILLGGMVSDFFRSKSEVRIFACPFADGLLLKWAGIDESGRIVLAVAHPSYVGIYARKRIGDYADAILNAIRTLLKDLAV